MNKKVILIGLAIVGLFYYFKNNTANNNDLQKESEDNAAILKKQQDELKAAQLRKQKQIDAANLTAGDDVKIYDLKTVF